MTSTEKIQAAADIIKTEMGKRGVIINDVDALYIGRQFFILWERTEQYNIVGLKPGDIAKNFRARYEAQAAADGAIIEADIL